MIDPITRIQQRIVSYRSAVARIERRKRLTRQHERQLIDLSIHIALDVGQMIRLSQRAAELLTE